MIIHSDAEKDINTIFSCFFYSKFKNGTWHEAIKASYAQGAEANGLTVIWDDENVVYFACQARTESVDSYEHGDIGTMGKAWGTI